MRVEIKPSRPTGKIAAPPSKSMAHRLLICAGLCDGESVVRGVDPSDDISATLDCLASLGAVCEFDKNNVRVRGISPKSISARGVLNCRECGSTLRFFAPICMLSEQTIALTGSEKLLSRPLDVYEKLAREKGCLFENNGEIVTVRGPLKSGVYTVSGEVSSQFISGLLFALPTSDENSEIVITGNIESRPYIDMTVDALEKFGVCSEWTGKNTIRVRGGQSYISADVAVEGDYSNAAFFDALNAVGGNVSVDGLSGESRQGDKIYREYFAALDAGAPALDLSNCPDLGPVMFAVAAEKHGASFTHTRRLRLKESDRVRSMETELCKFGAEFEISHDAVTVKSSALHAPTETLCGHGDHRVVMALAVLATKYGGVIDGAEAVRKSLPDFFEKLAALGAETEIT